MPLAGSPFFSKSTMYVTTTLCGLQLYVVFHNKCHYQIQIQDKDLKWERIYQGSAIMCM